MTPGTRRELNISNRAQGFTLVELLIVVAVLGILIAIAALSLRDWRPSLDAKQTATGLVNMLREARSNAVATNYQYKVDFDVPNGQYRMQRGAQAYNSTTWPTTVSGYTALSSGVTIASGATCNATATVDVQFNANGTAKLETPWTSVSPTPVTVCIQSSSSGKTYRIIVTPSGSVSLQ